MDPFQVEIISQRLIRDVYSEGAQIHMCAVAAIEIALWDIIGKTTRQPIYNLWGGRCHEKLRAYANGWYRGPRTPESFAEKAKRVAARGYTALKFDPFGSSWRMLSRYDFDLSLDIIRAVRDAVGPSVDLLIEGHCRFNVATAVEFAEAIHPFRPAWFEEPVPHTNIAAMVEVARRSPVPIATGESLSSKQQFAELLQHEVVNILVHRVEHEDLGAVRQCRLRLRLLLAGVLVGVAVDDLAVAAERLQLLLEQRPVLCLVAGGLRFRQEQGDLFASIAPRPTGTKRQGTHGQRDQNAHPVVCHGPLLSLRCWCSPLVS